MEDAETEAPFQVLYQRKPIVVGPESEARAAYDLLTSPRMLEESGPAADLRTRIQRERSINIRSGEIALFDVNAGRIVKRQGIAVPGDLADFDDRR